MLAAWQRGATGFPLVDAGMRQLWATGWMQQSVRMVCAAFLTEYLSISWVRRDTPHRATRVVLDNPQSMDPRQDSPQAPLTGHHRIAMWSMRSTSTLRG